MKIYTCIKCDNEICKKTALRGSGLCHSCAGKISIHKSDCKCGICRDKSGDNNPMFGVKSPNFLDGRTIKIYYCSICKKEISYQSGLYGLGKCNSCNQKGRTRKAWNKGLIGMSGKRLIELNKNTIINHHIDLKENSNRILQMPQGQHRRLHWKSYNYVVSLGLVQDYLKGFLENHKDAIVAQNVQHHIDCDRENNKIDNFLYVASKAIHNKLHQEAYEYLVKKSMIDSYISWFFLMEKKNTHEEKSKGGTIL